MSELVNALVNKLKETSENSKREMIEHLLAKEYEDELEKVNFDISKIHITNDGRWKSASPIKICKKSRNDCLRAIYEYFYGKIDKTLGDVYLLWLRSFSKLVEQGHRTNITLDSYKSYYKKYIEKSWISAILIKSIKTSTLHVFYADSAAKG